MGIQGIPNNPLGQLRTQVEVELAKDLKHIYLTKFNDNKDEIERWLIELESYFMVRGCSSNVKIALTNMHLSDMALDWWNTHLNHTGYQAIDIPWEDFVVLFKECFLNKQYYLEKQNEFFKLNQRSNSLDHYYHEFIQLLKYLPLYEGNDPMKTQKFILRLDSQIGTNINMHKIDTLIKAYNLAKKVETNQVVRRATIEQSQNYKTKMKDNSKEPPKKKSTNQKNAWIIRRKIGKKLRILLLIHQKEMGETIKESSLLIQRCKKLTLIMKIQLYPKVMDASITKVPIIPIII